MEYETRDFSLYSPIFNAFAGSVIDDLKEKIEALEDNSTQITALGNRVTALATDLSNTKGTVSTNQNKLINLKSAVDGIKNRPTVAPPQVDEKSKTWYRTFYKSIIHFIFL